MKKYHFSPGDFNILEVYHPGIFSIETMSIAFVKVDIEIYVEFLDLKGFYSYFPSFINSISSHLPTKGIE